MKRTMIHSLPQEVGKTVTISGWVHRVRKLKAVVFVILRDRTGLVQLALSPSLFESLNLRLETVISAQGLVVESPNKLGPIEVQVTSLQVLNQVAEDLPLQVNGSHIKASLDTLLNHRVLALRHERQMAIFKVQSALSQAFSSFLQGQGFLEIRTPKLVKEGAEGGANVFSLDYFGQRAYLAQSPQFYKQMMVASGAERVFEIAPVFRAEAHSTSRHLNEYISMDMEMGFIESEEELMELETNLLAHMIKHLNETCTKELACLEVTLPKVPEAIPTLKLQEAIDILKTQYGKRELEGDLDPEGEKLISEHVRKETGSDFLFLTHYPQTKRPMYTLPCGETESHSFDLLFRGLEITTGGLRIHQAALLEESMVKKGLNPEEYSTYVDTFRYGAPPHGGLAIGLERLTAQLLGHPMSDRPPCSQGTATD